MTEKKLDFTIKEDGFHAKLCECDNMNNPCPNKILIICSGSEGDFELTKTSSQNICKNGINTLALGYFNVPDAPNCLNKVPIDYVGKAATYLKSIGYEKIGIWGISMGSIYALTSASYFPDLISLVFAASPNYFVVEAMNSSKSRSLKASIFSYKGEEIPYEPYPVTMNLFKNYYHTLLSLEPNFSYLYNDMMGKVAEEHIIPVEKMKARLVLFSGKLDVLWPSNQGSKLIMERLKKKNYAYPYEHIECEYGGHLMVPFTTRLDKLMKANRQYPKETEQYRQNHLNKLIETYKEW